MNDFEVEYPGENAIEVKTGYGSVRLDFGRPTTVKDAQSIQEIIGLGARLYAEKIRQAQLKVDDLIHWRKS